MHVQRYVLAVLVVVFLVPEVSEAQLFRRWRRNNNYTYNYVNTGYVAAPVSSAKPITGVSREHSGYDRNEYDYNWAARRNWHSKDAEPMLFSDKVRINMFLKDADAEVVDDLRVRATWFYLHKSRTPHQTFVDIERKDGKVFYDVPGIEEGRVVKVVSDFYVKTDAQPPNEEALKNASYIQTDDGTFKFTGRVHVPYYGVTSSDSNEELIRRARIVSFGFSQWYVDEAFGGRYCDYDCYSFYQSSAGGELDGFSLQPVAHADVPGLTAEGKRFHGDHLTMPGHYGMALCYDEDTGNFCTLEGNYALNGPYRVNIDPSYHGLYTWSSILTITQDETPEIMGAE